MKLNIKNVLTKIFVKRIDQITLRDYDRMERFGHVNQFKRFWLPDFVVIGYLRTFVANIIQFVNDTRTEDEKIDKITWKLNSEIKILYLRTAYYGILNSVTFRDKFKGLLGLYKKHMKKKKITIKKDSNFQKYKHIAMQYSGISVVTYGDLEKLKRHLQFRIDKYNENFKESEQEKEKTYLMAEALGVFSYLNMSFDGTTTLVEYKEAKNRAIEISNNLKSKKNG